jgi:hypothetical protein
VSNVSIYFNESSASVFRYHLYNVAGRTSESWSFFHDRELFKQATGKRIALFQIPYPYTKDIDQEIDDIYQYADKILIIGSELHPATVDFIRRYDKDRVFFFICGNLNFKLDFAYAEKFLDWFTTSVHFYKNVKPSVLYNLKPYETKPLTFDALLGRKKPHRDLAYNFINNNNLADTSITTYINDHNITFKADDDRSWIWGNQDVATLENINKIEWTVERVKYHNYNISLSQIIPIDIYNQTAYSLVCETNFDNDFVFYTEKTVKPILARRLFITLGNRYHLEGLRRLGFKTFHGIIDESYDSIEGTIDRHNAALEQLKWLCEQDQADILARCRDIVEHNYDIMYGNDWYNLFKRPFGQHFF